MGETISATKVTFVCGLWSVGVVGLLSADPSSYFCIHQLLFPCLEVLVQSASLHNAVGCKVLPGLGVDVKCVHISLADSARVYWHGTNTVTITPGAIQDIHWSISFEVIIIIDNNNNHRIQRRNSRLFYNLLTAPRTVSNTYTPVARAQSCANHVQHIERSSRVTCRVTCHVERRDSSPIKFDSF